MKLLGLLLEITLLFLSLAPDEALTNKFASVVLLSVLSTSFSSITVLFDDDIFVRWIGWPRAMRLTAVFSLMFGFAMFLGSVAMLYVVNVYDVVTQVWLPTAFAIMLLCIPRMALYGFMFALDIGGLASPTQNGEGVHGGIDSVIKEFGGRRVASVVMPHTIRCGLASLSPLCGDTFARTFACAAPQRMTFGKPTWRLIAMRQRRTWRIRRGCWTGTR